MSSYSKVAIAGATGNLGPSIVRELVAAGLQVTALSRSGTTTDLPAEVKVVKVDYANQDTLVAALKGQDVFVSNIPKHDEQEPLIDAAIAAGVKLFIPSEFGSNVSGNEKVAALPVFKGKLSTQAYLKKRQAEIDWTVIVNSLFLDWGLGVGIAINPKGTTQLYDGGDKFVSMTLLSDIGKAVVGVIKHPEETRNRTVYVQSAVTSQNKLLELAKKSNPSLEASVKQVNTEELLKDSYVKLKAGGDQIRPAMLGFIFTSIFGDGYGSNFTDLNDNALLGIKDLPDTELEKVVAKYV